MKFTADKRERLDVLISKKANVTRNKAKRLIEEGFVLVDGKAVKKAAYKTKIGQSVEFEIPQEAPLSAEPQKIPLDVIYEDEDVIVINKPAGLVVHPAPGHREGTLVNALLYHCRDLKPIGSAVRPGIVHRLDKDTAGLLVVAKNEFSLNHLTEQFKKRTVGRFYRAFVLGILDEDEGKIDVPIGRDRFNRKKFSPRTNSPKQAITNFKVLNRFRELNFTDIRCKLETGRTHQIRVHMSFLGHPLLGDQTYGFKESRVKDNKLRELIRQMGMHALCAYYLSFTHPRTGKICEFQVDIPEGMRRILEYAKGKDGSAN